VRITITFSRFPRTRYRTVLNARGVQRQPTAPSASPNPTFVREACRGCFAVPACPRQAMQGHSVGRYFLCVEHYSSSPALAHVEDGRSPDGPLSDIEPAALAASTKAVQHENAPAVELADLPSRLTAEVLPDLQSDHPRAGGRKRGQSAGDLRSQRRRRAAAHRSHTADVAPLLEGCQAPRQTVRGRPRQERNNLGARDGRIGRQRIVAGKNGDDGGQRRGGGCGRAAGMALFRE
jgi:hypothetical protein